MKINVSEFFSTQNKKKTFSVQFDLDEVTLSGTCYPVSYKEQFDLSIANIGKKEISVKGNSEIGLIVPCDRCLEDVEIRVPVEISFNVAKETTIDEEKEWNESILLEGCILDVDMLVYDEIVAHFPLKILCKEDCKGICKVCGMNLNKGACDCDQFVEDPRMSAIRDIFNNFKEV